jgi:predicted transcriptional regulator of viral defense system
VRWLARAGWLVRLTAGRYAIVPLSSGSEAVPQTNRYVITRDLLSETLYYISHESAMDVHNMLTACWQLRLNLGAETLRATIRT